MYNLTRQQALFIKVLKMKHNCTWTTIHREYQCRYHYRLPLGTVSVNLGNEPVDIEGKQWEGILLSEAAMKKLNEKQDDGWI